MIMIQIKRVMCDVSWLQLDIFVGVGGVGHLDFNHITYQLINTSYIFGCIKKIRSVVKYSYDMTYSKIKVQIKAARIYGYIGHRTIFIRRIIYVRVVRVYDMIVRVHII